MSIRKIWDYTIDIKEGFMLRKGKVYPLSREERGSIGIYQGIVKKRVYQALEVAPNNASVLYREEGWKEENGARLSVS